MLTKPEYTVGSGFCALAFPLFIDEDLVDYYSDKHAKVGVGEHAGWDVGHEGHREENC